MTFKEPPLPSAVPLIHRHSPIPSMPQWRWSATALFALLLTLLGHPAQTLAAEEGVSNDAIRMGGVMDLEGRSKGLGQGMAAGIEAALKDVTIQHRQLEFTVLNDSYNPEKTVEATRQLVDSGVFLVAGNVGTPTAKVSLPILEKQAIPAVGFFTGAGLLRTSDKTHIVNYRASYTQEISAVIQGALEHDIDASEVCAYVQNDAYGMAGIQGIINAIQGRKGSQEIIQSLEKLLHMPGENPPRNGIGPVGVYQRNTYLARPGYTSIKQWEKNHGTHCRLVVTVGAYTSVAKFIGYARYKQENWLFSAVSFTGAENFKTALKEMNTDSGVIMTQVVPQLRSNLEIVKKARQALGANFNSVSLEGYIVGRLIVHGLEHIEGGPTRQRFLDALMGKSFDLGGLKMDFSDDNQGSDLVTLTILRRGGWQPMQDSDWTGIH